MAANPQTVPRLLQRQEVGREEKAESKRFRSETGRQDGGPPRTRGLGTVFEGEDAPLLTPAGRGRKVLRAAVPPSQGAGPPRRADAHLLRVSSSASVSLSSSSLPILHPAPRGVVTLF